MVQKVNRAKVLFLENICKLTSQRSKKKKEKRQHLGMKDIATYSIDIEKINKMLIILYQYIEQLRWKMPFKIQLSKSDPK